MKLKRILVHWLDASGDLTKQVWSGDEVKHEPLHVYTLGYLWKEDDIGVTMFTEYIEDDEVSFRGRMFIPKGMIVEVSTLNVSKTKKGS